MSNKTDTTLGTAEAVEALPMTDKPQTTTIIDELHDIANRLPGDATWNDVEAIKRIIASIQLIKGALLYAKLCIETAEGFSGNRLFIGGKQQIDGALNV